MIIKAVRVLRADRRHLNNTVAHIMRGSENEEIALFQGALGDVDDFHVDALAHRRGGAKYCCRHYVIAPEQVMTRDQAMEALRTLATEFGFASDNAVMVEHRKPRHGRKGHDIHWHALVGEVDPVRGRVIDTHNDMARHEKVARLLEVKFGHRLVKGRHNRAVLAALTSEAPDVAAAVVAAGLAEGTRPVEAYTHGQHAAAKKAGRSMPNDKAAVATAWEAADGRAAFQGALAEAGMRLAPGAKPGVWVVETHAGEFVGAVDRLTNTARGDVVARLGEPIPAAGVPSRARLVRRSRPAAAAPEREETDVAGGRDLAAAVQLVPSDGAGRAALVAPFGRDERVGSAPARADGGARAVPGGGGRLRHQGNGRADPRTGAAGWRDRAESLAGLGGHARGDPDLSAPNSHGAEGAGREGGGDPARALTTLRQACPAVIAAAIGRVVPPDQLAVIRGRAAAALRDARPGRAAATGTAAPADRKTVEQRPFPARWAAEAIAREIATIGARVARRAALRRAAAAAAEVARDAERDVARAERAVEDHQERRPCGVLAWLMGRTAAWRRQLVGLEALWDKAHKAERDTETERRCAHAAAARAGGTRDDERDEARLNDLHRVEAAIRVGRRDVIEAVGRGDLDCATAIVRPRPQPSASKGPVHVAAAPAPPPTRDDPSSGPRYP